MSELPKSWRLTKLSEILTYKKGKKPKRLEEEPFEGSVPYLDIKAFEKDVIVRYADVESSNLIEKTSVGIVWDGARSGWVSKGKEGAVGSTIAILKPMNVETDFLYRFLQSKFDYINTNTRGTGIPHVDPQILWDIDFPLPPLGEQKRMVAKLDKLFGELEDLKASLARIPDLLKNFRQAVLTQAVTGKLLDQEVTLKKLEDFEIKIKTGPFGSALHKSDYIENGIPVINPSHILKGNIVPNPSVTINEAKSKELISWFLESDDVILGRRGEMGRAAKYEGQGNEMICGTGSLVLRVSSKLSADFLTYYLRSPFCINFLESNSVGTTMINLNQTILKSLPFPDLSYEEQVFSIKKVEGLFASASVIEESYEQLKSKIDTLPQAILAKAFRGELVDQLETDGDAAALLEEIKVLKEGLSKKGKSRKI